VAQERLQDGTWYDDENGSDQVDLLKPKTHLSDAERIGQLLEKLFDPSNRSDASKAYKLGELTYYLGLVERWMGGRRHYEYEDWDERPVDALELKCHQGSVRRNTNRED
jgi:hypothetical protein